MDNKELENPEEVQTTLDFDALADGFRKRLDISGPLKAINQHLEPLVSGLQQFMTAIAPVLGAIVSEFKNWNISSEVLRKAGWIPHYTTPFDLIAGWGEEPKAVGNQLLHYYDSNWKDVRSQMEARLAHYQIDEEAKATLREALDAHEARLYRCVSRVLFPEIERVFRTKLFDGQVGPIPYKELVSKLVGEDRSLGDFMSGGFYELDIFGHLTKHIENGDKSEGSKFIYGLFQKVGSEEDQERLMQDPIPNRHAALHGLVVYSSQQNSLNAIFIADYIFRIFGQALLPKPPPPELTRSVV